MRKPTRVLRAFAVRIVFQASQTIWCLASVVCLISSSIVSRPSLGASPATAAEVELKQHWADAYLLKSTNDAALPFSFKLAGQDSRSLLSSWEKSTSSEMLDDQRTRHTITWTDPKSGLAVSCVAVDYRDYPTIEWTLHFKNTGTADAPLLNYVFALDTRFQREQQGEFALHAFNGSTASPGDYGPRLVPMGKDAKESFGSDGRSSEGAFPYFNIDWGAQGVIGAIGWPGSWSAHFERAGERDLHVFAGMTTIEMALKPGEEIRSPLIVLQFWKGGDWIDAQNVWRHWMVDHNIPREKDNHVPAPFTYTCVDDAFPGMRSNAKGEIESMNRYLKHGLKFDYWWIDAGWYPNRGDWTDVGDWRPDPERYPNGLREVADAAHKNGMKFIVWFEPERVRPGTWLAIHHPEWLLGAPSGERLFNWGNPAALAWMTDHISNLITTQGIDLYRQDFNMNPSGYWRGEDKPGRIGVAEAKYAAGFLAYWDGLRQRHPGMLIDSCASGGRRNDLETMRRAVPLLRSDYRFEPNGTEGHNFGMSMWIPFNGTGCSPDDPYRMRSHFCAGYGFGGPNGDPNFNYEGRKKMDAEWRSVADNFVVGDYYPLSPYSISPDVWLAWQFNRPDLKHGVVQAFRHDKNNEPVAHLKLRGLDPSATYELKNYDEPTPARATGKELMDPGLEVHLEKAGSAATIAYKQVQ